METITFVWTLLCLLAGIGSLSFKTREARNVFVLFPVISLVAVVPAFYFPNHLQGPATIIGFVGYLFGVAVSIAVVRQLNEKKKLRRTR